MPEPVVPPSARIVTHRAIVGQGRGGVGLMVLLGSLTALGPLSMDMYLPAFPEMAGEFGVSQSQIQLSLATCLFGLAGGQLIAGPLSDHWGRRRLVLTGVLAYTVVSLLCVFAPSAGTLTALRLIQGLGSGVGIVLSRAIVRDLYTGRAVAQAFSRLTLVFGIAPIAAPGIGSLALTITSWRGIFVVLTGIGAALLVAVALFLPETLTTERRATGGFAETRRSIAALLGDRLFTGYALAQGLAYAGLFAYISGSAFVLQDGFGISDGMYSLIFGANALGIVLLSQVNARLLARLAPRPLLVTGLVSGLAASTGLGVCALLGTLPGVVATLFVYVASLGLVMPNGTALALSRNPRRAGTAAAVLGAGQLGLGGLATPLVGLGDAGTATPMALVIVGCAALAVASVMLVARSPTLDSSLSR
jgi:MFS transporter, DHA1 family, multidrug resistance protein